MTVGDPEDGPPNEIPAAPFSDLPPAPIEHFDTAQEAPTMPPSPVDEALASAVAGYVIASLAPQLKRLDTVAMELRTWVQNAEPRLDFFDRKIVETLQLFKETAANVERIADAIGPRRDDQPPLFDALHQLEERVTNIEGHFGITMPPPVLNGSGE